MNSRRTKLIAAATTVVVLGAGGGGAYALAGGAGGDDGEKSATGPGAAKAQAAALKATKGGEANAVERDGENGAYWEVEVTKTDGKTVDVRLAKDLSVVVIEGDTEDAGGR